MRAFMRFQGVLALAFVLSVVSSGTVFAQDEIAVIETDDILEAVVVDTAEEAVIPLEDNVEEREAVEVVSEEDLMVLDGIRPVVPDKAPSKLGLFFRNIRERVTLGLTNDPVKKAEKQLQFAEERMQLAEMMEDERLREIMMEKASAMMEKVEARKEIFLEKANDEKVTRLLNNVAAHQLRREAVMDRIEAKLNPAELERFEEKRGELLDKGQALMAALESEELPPIVRDRVQLAADRVEEHARLLDSYKSKRDALRDQLEDDPDAWRDAVAQLHAAKKIEMSNIKEDWKQEREALRVERASLNQEDKAAVREAIQNAPTELQNTIAELRRQVEAQGIDPAVLEAQGLNLDGLSLDKKLQGLIQNRVDQQKAKLQAKADGVAEEIRAEVERKVEERINQEIEAQKAAIRARVEAAKADALNRVMEEGANLIGGSGN